VIERNYGLEMINKNAQTLGIRSCSRGRVPAGSRKSEPDWH